MSLPHYHLNIFWSEEEGLWIADFPDLMGCTTHGDTPAEAATNAEEALAGWLDVSREHGDVIPEPRYRPFIYADRFPHAA